MSLKGILNAALAVQLPKKDESFSATVLSVEKEKRQSYNIYFFTLSDGEVPVCIFSDQPSAPHLDGIKKGDTVKASVIGGYFEGSEQRARLLGRIELCAPKQDNVPRGLCPG